MISFNHYLYILIYSKYLIFSLERKIVNLHGLIFNLNY